MFEHQVFHVHWKYLESSSGNCFKSDLHGNLKSALPVIQNQLLKCFFIVCLQGVSIPVYELFLGLLYGLNQLWQYEKTVVRSRSENGPKIFVDRNSNSPIHDSWRELFKAIPVYLFLTALWLSPVCMLCAFKAFFFAQFFHFSIGQFHFATWAGNYSCKNNL